MRTRRGKICKKYLPAALVLGLDESPVPCFDRVIIFIRLRSFEANPEGNLVISSTGKSLAVGIGANNTAQPKVQ
jgi:hypothetical protein